MLCSHLDISCILKVPWLVYAHGPCMDASEAQLLLILHYAAVRHLLPLTVEEEMRYIAKVG